MKHILRQFFTEEGRWVDSFNQPVFSLETSTIFYQRLSLSFPPLFSSLSDLAPSLPLPSPSSPPPLFHTPPAPSSSFIPSSPCFSLPSPPLKPTLRLEIRRRLYTPPASPPTRRHHHWSQGFHLGPCTHTIHFRISGTNIHLLGGKDNKAPHWFPDAPEIPHNAPQLCSFSSSLFLNIKYTFVLGGDSEMNHLAAQSEFGFSFSRNLIRPLAGEILGSG